MTLIFTLMNDTQKQVVQWFPGHMAKTRRLIKESLPFVDLVTEIVDARIPMSSSNPELSEMIGNKPRIVLLNKCDVADEKATQLWVDCYKPKGIYAIPVDCRTGKGLNAYLPLVRNVLKDKIKKITNVEGNSKKKIENLVFLIVILIITIGV